MKLKKVVLMVGFLALFLSTAHTAEALEGDNQVIFGVKISAGGRYDDIRMCVGSPAGVKGGPAMDVSFFTEIGLSDEVSLAINIPVVRPILFGAAFSMLQFEPEVSLLFRIPSENKIDFVLGPSLGITFHYGPDFNSDSDNRGPDFFALGPRIGGYAGLDFKRPDKTMNFQLGVSPYVSPLFSVNDPDNHRGLIVGGMLDALFRFSPQ